MLAASQWKIEFFSEVSQNPTAAQKDELVARLKVFQGCEDWTRTHCSNWFSRQRRKYASINNISTPTFPGDLTIAAEGVQYMSSVSANTSSNNRKKTTGDIRES